MNKIITPLIVALIAFINAQGITNTIGGNTEADKFIVENSDSETSLVVTGEGNVGVGTNTPDEKLQINGTAQMSGFKLTTGAANGFVLTSDVGGIGTWQASPTYSDDDWTISGNNIYSTSAGNVGIGTTSPSAKLHVTGDDGVLFTGTFDGGTIPIEGDGTRMMWYPKKAAFRVGYTYSGSWDDDQIGDYSVAMGYSTMATGHFSTVMGEHSVASGSVSTAMGSGTVASGNESTALGSDTEASGGHSITMGKSTRAIGDYSTAIGLDTKAESYSTVAIGKHNVGGGNATNWIDTDPLFEIGNGADDSNRNNVMTVLKNGKVGIGTATPNGLLDVNGSIYQRGGSLHADYVFDEGYELESIKEHADFMWTNKHLRAIPKAKTDENGKEIVEVGAHRKGIVEELEKAHIYISQLEERITKLEELFSVKD